MGMSGIDASIYIASRSGCRRDCRPVRQRRQGVSNDPNVPFSKGCFGPAATPRAFFSRPETLPVQRRVHRHRRDAPR